jgi:Ca2+/H+ antiporter
VEGLRVDVMASLALVLPVFTITTPTGTYNTPQLAFVAVASGSLWAIFVFVQTIRHRDYFIPVTDAANPEVQAERPTTKVAWAALGCCWCPW